MGRFPVYQSPALDAVEKRMRTIEAHHGYLTEADGPLVTLLIQDEIRVKELGLTHEAIAAALRQLTHAAAEAQGCPMVVENKWRVHIDAFRGKIPCPWGHPGLYPKTHVHLERVDTGASLQWTDLAIHLIEAHGFYQGTQSPYRLDPEIVAKVLELTVSFNLPSLSSAGAE